MDQFRSKLVNHHQCHHYYRSHVPTMLGKLHKFDFSIWVHRGLNSHMNALMNEMRTKYKKKKKQNQIKCFGINTSVP